MVTYAEGVVWFHLLSVCHDGVCRKNRTTLAPEKRQKEHTAYNCIGRLWVQRVRVRVETNIKNAHTALQKAIWNLKDFLQHQGSLEIALIWIEMVMCAGKTGNVGNAGKTVVSGCWCAVGTFLRSPLNLVGLCWNVNFITPIKIRKETTTLFSNQHKSFIWTPMLNPGAVYHLLIWIKLRAWSQIQALGAFALACFIAVTAGALCVFAHAWLKALKKTQRAKVKADKQKDREQEMTGQRWRSVEYLNCLFDPLGWSWVIFGIQVSQKEWVYERRFAQSRLT